MLHAFAFADGRVSYANRFLQTSAYKAYRREGDHEVRRVRNRPVPADLQRRLDASRCIGKIPNANVSIEHLAGRFRAHTELPVPVSFEPQNLRTLGVDVDAAAGPDGHRPPPSRPPHP